MESRSSELQHNPELVKAVRVLAWLARSLESACAGSGLSLAKYRILMLMPREPLRAAELASLARVSAPTLSGLVDALVRDGLIERLPSSVDRRGVLLVCTESGRAARRRAEECLARELVAQVERHAHGPLAQGPSRLAEIYDRLLERWQAQGGLAALGLDPIPSAEAESRRAAAEADG